MSNTDQERGLTLREYRERKTAGRQTFLDRAVAWISPERGLRRMAARTRLQLAATYRGAETGRLRKDWVLGTDDTTPDVMELDRLRDRARDLNRNDPVASGATETMGINIVGQGLQPQSRIRAERLGITEARASELQHQAEEIWDEWGLRADGADRLDFSEIQFLALRKIIEDGEVLALPIMVTDEPWRRIKRAVELIEADRLDPYAAGKVNDTGIKFGGRGQPLTYYIKKIDPVDGTEQKTIEIAARDRDGRPMVLHPFRSLRAGQQRGVPFFAPVLTYFKDLADYLEAEAVAARVAACLAVFITKNDPMYAQYMQQSGDTDTSGNKLQAIEPGMVSYLGVGEGIGVVDPKRPGDAFGTFVEGMLRMIGAALNLPYELLVKDFSKTNYSSARAALLEGRRMFGNWRSWFGRKFCKPLWDLVLEEAFLRGLFDAPDFYRHKAEYCRAVWIGGGWGWVDPVKEVEASRKAIDYGLSTLAEEAAGQGRDWEEVLEQQKRENDMIGELGLNIRHAGKQDAGGKAEEPEEPPAR